MPKLTIEGVPPFDGSYDLDIAKFKGSELHTIKQISGVRAGELQEALTAGDYDLVVAMTVIVLRRAGREVDPEQIMEADVGAITVDLTDTTEEVEERPPDFTASEWKRELVRRRRKRARWHRNFWAAFERTWGLASEPPESYWQPWLGSECGLRPCDIGDLTPYQLDGCHDWAKARGVTFG